MCVEWARPVSAVSTYTALHEVCFITDSQSGVVMLDKKFEIMLLHIR